MSYEFDDVDVQLGESGVPSDEARDSAGAGLDDALFELADPLDLDAPDDLWDSVCYADVDDDEFEPDLCDATVDDGSAAPDRARDLSSRFAREQNLGAVGARALERVFSRQISSNTTIAVLRRVATEAPLTDEGVALAVEIRDLWESRPEYFAYLGDECRKLPYDVRMVSWALALRLAALPWCGGDIDEVEQVLALAYDSWYGRPSLTYDYPSFYVFVRDVVCHVPDRHHFRLLIDGAQVWSREAREAC